MTGQNIKKKKINKKNSTLGALKTDKKQEIIFFLYRATKAEKIEHAKLTLNMSDRNRRFGASYAIIKVT